MTSIAPNPSVPERPGNTVDKIIAKPPRNAVGRRAGELWASDGTSWIPANLGGFAGGVTDSVSGASHQSYDAQIAGPGRSAVGAGLPAPSWDAVPKSSLDGFAAGSSGDPGRADPFMDQPRRGFNTQTISPLDGLSRGSRPNTTYVHQVAPANGGRGRRNPSDITEL